MNEVKGEISNITNWAATTALTAVEKKKNLMLVIFSKKTDYNLT